MADEYTLKVYMRRAQTRALGRGLRYALWVQGCPLNCAGCLVPNSHSDAEGELVSIYQIALEISAEQEIEGITISGGEPFGQAQALSKLISLVKAERDLGVITYTGYTQAQLLREIQREPEGAWASFYSQIDLLIDGRFVESLNDDGALRGSANQRAIPLTERYVDDLKLYGSSNAGRRVEVSWRHDELTLVGVPSQQLLSSLRENGYLAPYADERSLR